MRVVIQGLDVKVRIRCDEIEDIVLGETEPVFPSLVPSFYKHLVESMLCGEVDVAAHVLVVSSMYPVWLKFAVVCLAEFH